MDLKKLMEPCQDCIERRRKIIEALASTKGVSAHLIKRLRRNMGMKFVPSVVKKDDDDADIR